MKNLSHTATAQHLGNLVSAANAAAQTAAPAPRFTVGETVTTEIEQQRARVGGAANVKARKVMEVGSVEWREALPYSDEPDGWGYRLRRPGSKTKGGSVLWAEADLAVAE